MRALNFLLPHIRRIPNALQRDEFANNAAQQLGIDSAIMRQEFETGLRRSGWRVCGLRRLRR